MSQVPEDVVGWSVAYAAAGQPLPAYVKWREGSARWRVELSPDGSTAVYLNGREPHPNDTRKRAEAVRVARALHREDLDREGYPLPRGVRVSGRVVTWTSDGVRWRVHIKRHPELSTVSANGAVYTPERHGDAYHAAVATAKHAWLSPGQKSRVRPTKKKATKKKLPGPRLNAVPSGKVGRAIRRATIKEHRKSVERLKQDLGKLRERRRALRDRLTSLCSRGREQARARVKALREQEEARVRHAVDLLRAEARARCAARRERAKLAYKTDRARLRAEVRSKEREASELRALNERGLSDKERRARARKLERSQERESFVLADIPAELHAVYRRVKSTLPKATRNADGTIKTSRAERFFEWVEEHPDQVISIAAAKAERDLARLVKQHETEETKLHERQLKALRKAGYSKAEAAGLLDLGIDPTAPRRASDEAPF